MGNIIPILRTATQSILRKCIYFLLLLSILHSTTLSAEQSENQKAFLSVTDILDAWEAGYGSIHSMKVKYTEDISLPDPNGNETVLRCTVERIEDDNKFYLKYSNLNPDFTRSESDVEAAFDEKVSTFCDYKLKYGTIDNGISTRGYNNGNSLARFMWLSRNYNNPDYPDGQTYFAYWVRDRLSGSLTSDKFRADVRPELETVLGESCHIVEIGYGDEVMRFWVAHNKGMCPMKYEKLIGQSQDVANRMETLAISKVMTDIGEVWYPSEMEQASGYIDRDTRKVQGYQTYKCQVQEFIPHLANIAPDTFRVKFPEGMRIRDNVLGITYTMGQTDNFLEELNSEISSSEQLFLESNQIEGAKNNISENIATDETQNNTNNENIRTDNSILGETQHIFNKYAYMLIICLTLIIFAGIGIYYYYRIIKQR